MRRAGDHASLEQLSALIDGELSAEERGAVEAHMATCARCRDDLDQLNRTVSLIRGLPVPAPPRSFKVASESRLVAPRPAPDLPWLRPLAAAAAALLVVSLAGIVLVGPRARTALESANAGLGAPVAAQLPRAPLGLQEMAQPDSAVTADAHAALEAPRMRGPAVGTALDSGAAVAPPATVVAPDALRAIEAGMATPTLAGAGQPLPPALGRRAVLEGGLVRVEQPTGAFSVADAVHAVVYLPLEGATSAATSSTYTWQVAGQREPLTATVPLRIAESHSLAYTHGCALARDLDPQASNTPLSLRVEVAGEEVARFIIRVARGPATVSPASCSAAGES